MSEPLSDAELIAAYKESGDLQVLATLYSRYHSLVYGLCLRYFKNVEDSQDASVNIFESLISSVKRHNIETFKNWLYTLTKNHCLEKLRKESRSWRKEKEAESMYSSMVFHPDNIMEKEAKLDKLEECIEALPLKQKECIRLFYLQKKSYQELSDELQLKWNTIRSFIQNGRRNLKNCMEKDHV